MAVLIVGGFLMVVALELPGLRQRKDRREMAIFGVLLGIGLTVSLLMAFHVPLPKVTSAITELFTRTGMGRTLH